MKPVWTLLPCAALSLACSSSDRANPPPSSIAVSAPKVAEGSRSPFTLPLPELLLNRRLSPRDLHRGDWETPSLVLLVHDSDWESETVELAKAARQESEVWVFYDPREPPLVHSRHQLAAAGAHLLMVELDSPWIRDYGPLQRRLGGAPTWLDFRYHEDRPLDDRAPAWLSTSLDVPALTSDLEIEGGAVISNGHGLCVMTERSFLEAQSGWDYEALGEQLLAFLGCRALTIVPSPVEEGTGHIDMFAQFSASDRAVVVEADADENPELADMLDDIADRVVEAGRALDVEVEIVRVPSQLREADSGDIDFYSYANALQLGGRVLLPRYQGVPERFEQRARESWSKAAPNKRIVTIDAEAMIRRGGALHCLTLGLGLDHKPEPRLKHPRAVELGDAI